MAAPQLTLGRLPLAAKIGMGAAAVAGVLFTYWLIFYSEVASKIAGAERQRGKLAGDLTAVQGAEQGYFADRGELALREQRSRELNKVLPPDADEDAFLTTIQDTSNTAGVVLRSYAPLDEVRQAYYAKVPMRLGLTGNYHQIIKFAYELGRVDRIINVENIQLNGPRPAGDDIILTASCLVTAFHALRPRGR
jgi:type IV pilus assembly protein PilO